MSVLQFWKQISIFHKCVMWKYKSRTNQAIQPTSVYNRWSISVSPQPHQTVFLYKVADAIFPSVHCINLYKFHIFQMHNSFLWSSTVLPKRNGEEREKKRRERSCWDEVLHESVPGSRPTLWRHRDKDLILPSTIFPFPLVFIVGGEPPVTLGVEWGSIKCP